MTGLGAWDVLTLMGVAGVLVLSALLGASTFARRALAVLAVMLGACVLVSATLRAVPGDPVVAILGEDASDDAVRALSQDLGLADGSGARLGVLAQTARFIRGVGTASVLVAAPSAWHPALVRALPDEPRSFRSREPVRVVVLRRLPYTAALAFCSVLVALVLGVGLGVVAAASKGRAVGAAAEALSLAGAAMPRFFLAPLLILVFAIGLRWLPPSGADDGWRSLVLPSLSLGTALAALLARMTRASLREVLALDFIRTARAKGASHAIAVVRHGLRAGLIPVVTVLGMQLGGLLAGAVITEKIFVWPGIGLLLLDAIRRLDVPVVQGVVLFIALFGALSTLAVDALVLVLDPRVRR